MSSSDSGANEAALFALEARVGHPGEKLAGLRDKIQAEGIKSFAEVEDAWLDLMWTLDTYRVEGLPPRGMGKKDSSQSARLGAVYRSKGNWFAEVVALLLQNRTSEPIAPKQTVQGFSQTHQIDVAWPAREEDPLICTETKVTGAPAYGSTPARGAMSDFSNRRKELKFAATDLKLYRRDQETKIDHWAVWREHAAPKTYFLWAARLRPGERVAKMVEEAQALVNTYLDGAGIFAWEENPSGDGYLSVPLPHLAQVTTLDDVLHRIASEISSIPKVGGKPPEPVTPDRRAVSVEKLPGD